MFDVWVSSRTQKAHNPSSDMSNHGLATFEDGVGETRDSGQKKRGKPRVKRLPNEVLIPPP